MKKRARRNVAWSYQTGERGKNRVNAYDRGERGFYLEFRERGERGGQGRRVRIALGPTGREEAKAKADELALEFRCNESPKSVPLTLGKLFDIYEREVTPAKSPGSQAHDRRCSEMYLRFFGADRQPSTLSLRDWQRFICERRAGRVAPAKSRFKGQIGEEIIRSDLAFLSAVLNFGTMAGDGKGGALLERNPVKGLPYPRNISPTRPALSEEQYLAVRRESAKLSPSAELFVVLAHETGHRAGSIRQLRWSDINLAGRRIHWRGGTDKMGFDHWTPATDEAIAMLTRERNARLAIGDAYLFPSRKDASKPMDSNAAGFVWDRLAKLAELPTGQRLGWHALRRKFASELRNTNLRDLCDLGGWKKPETVLTCYVRPNEDAQRTALSGRMKLDKVAVS
jgi:integrase